MESPAKRSRKLLDDDSSSDSGDESGGVPIGKQTSDAFKVNEEYARRFEYNKKREEMAQLESKLGKGSALGKRRNDESDEEDSSDEEDEDEDGELATEALDAEIFATLNAIRSKDPRVYDEKTTFYTKAEEGANPEGSEQKEKPMTLRDYHTKNLLSGAHLAEEDGSEPPKTYAQEQEDLKSAIVKEMHAAADDDDSSADENMDEDGGFIIPKSKPAPAPKAETKQLDVKNADRDPENFLSNFLSSRAWIPANRTELQPFESEDEDEEDRAEAFEEAYNFRFEDPNKMNERIMTHARDATNQQSVRREEKSTRKKIREAEQLRKEEEKKQREVEKSRLRKLKVEQLQDKVNKVKEVAGLRASGFTDEDWAKFLDEAWDDKNFEKEMQKRFGEDYYAENDAEVSDDEGKSKKKKKPKKPTWDDDIDITDLVPDFEDEEKPTVEQSDVEMDDGEDASESKNKKSKAQEKRDQKRDARKDRLRIEEAVDRNLDFDINLLPGATKKNSSRFRYRETSPQSFGLTARDILMADDTHLNKFAGLKKLASFRDPEQKRHDQKKLGKKARLREWRKDTFGDEEGPVFKFGGEKEKDDGDDEGKVDIREGEPQKKKRKRSKKNQLKL